MKLLTTVHHAVRIMTELASNGSDRPLSVRALGESEGVSAKYLEHILKALKTGGLVKSACGLRGGYVLARPPREISLADIFESLSEPLAPVDCVDAPGSCVRHEICAARDTWVELEKALSDVLGRTTVQELLERKRRKEGAASPMYFI